MPCSQHLQLFYFNVLCLAWERSRFDWVQRGVC